MRVRLVGRLVVLGNRGLDGVLGGRNHFHGDIQLHFAVLLFGVDVLPDVIRSAVVSPTPITLGDAKFPFAQRGLIRGIVFHRTDPQLAPRRGGSNASDLGSRSRLGCRRSQDLVPAAIVSVVL